MKRKILISMFVLLLLIGCTTNIRPPEWKGAEEMCKNNGGVLMIKATPILLTEVICNDGARYSMDTKGNIIK